MSFNCGILGLPNVGKSTLFNALTSTQIAESQNYPFCTIEPNVGKVSLKDERLNKISNISKSQNTIFSQLEFVDIAGLVEGASKGEGLETNFYQMFRALMQLYIQRCFEDKIFPMLHNEINPVNDINVIEQITLSDHSKITNIENIKRKKGLKIDLNLMECLELAENKLNNGIYLINIILMRTKLNTQRIWINTKPHIYVLNVDEQSASRK